jgi:hypothetical protein
VLHRGGSKRDVRIPKSLGRLVQAVVPDELKVELGERVDQVYMLALPPEGGTRIAIGGPR